MENAIIIIIAIILCIVLLIKLSGKLIKTIISFIFIGFIIYMFTGTDVISDFLKIIGIASDTVKIPFLFFG